MKTPPEPCRCKKAVTIDSLGGYQKVFNAIADATERYPYGIGISVSAFIRSLNETR